MYALELEGPSPESVAGRLATRLAEEGAVATVRQLRADPEQLWRRSNGDDPQLSAAETAVGVSGDARHVTRTGEQTLQGALEELAPTHEYALVWGVPDADLPTVAFGDAEPTGPVVHSAPTAEDVDVEEVLDAIEDVEPIVTLESLVAEIKRSDDSDLAGAIATFTGRVRSREGPDDPPTEHLEFERYDDVAQQRLQNIRTDLEARDGVYEVLAYHKSGVVEAGEDIVFVVVLAGHREEAFATVSDGIDRLKAEVPLFKKEVTVDEEFWRHERPSD